jgi:CubicO group peptidase (beta-lactamase class C family)
MKASSSLPVLVLLALATLVGCARAGSRLPPTPAAAPLSSTLDSVVRAFLAIEPGVPGAQVAVWHRGGSIFSRGYGYADLVSKRRVDSLTVFRIASLTKQFTAAAIVQLAEQRKLSLHDPLVHWVPEYASGEHVITLRHLLNHTSGIADAAEIRESADVLTPRAFFESIRGRPPVFAPGERYLYSNTGYHLLGIVIERASGRSYARILPLSIKRRGIAQWTRGSPPRYPPICRSTGLLGRSAQMRRIWCVGAIIL